MTDEQLNRLEHLAAAATPGPWSWRPTGDNRDVTGPYLGIGGQLIARLCGYPTNLRVCAIDTASRADGDFIAAARSAVPELIAEVRRLRAELRRRQESWASSRKRVSGQSLHPFFASGDR
jgi:hypothetical protein